MVIEFGQQLQLLVYRHQVAWMSLPHVIATMSFTLVKPIGFPFVLFV